MNHGYKQQKSHIKIELKIESDRWLEFDLRANWKKFVLKCVANVFKVTCWPYASEVSVLLTGDDEIAYLNKKYRNKDGATNVLSFPQIEFEKPADVSHIDKTENLFFLGDIVLSFETVLKESTQCGLEFLAHVAHLVVHGVLHLLGFDHISDSDATVMEGVETLILEHLSICDPYA